MIKFMHLADIHLESPFLYLADIDMIKNRQLEMRKTLSDVLKSANDDNIDFILISGDIMDGEIAGVATLNYLNDLFASINTKIIMILGNHDLYGNNNSLLTYKFKSSNVTVLSKQHPSITIGNTRIYGYISSDDILNKNLYNILLWHGDFASSGACNPLPDNIKKMGFNYIALGHIHQFMDMSTTTSKIIYPGCLFPRGFDELGKKGYVLVNYNLNVTEYEFIGVNTREYVSLNVDVSDCYFSSLSLAKKIKELITDSKNLYKIHLIGNRKSYEIISSDSILAELSPYAYFIMIEDKTTYNLNEETFPLLNDYVNKIDEMIKSSLNDNEKDILNRAKQIGIKALKNEVIADEN